MLSHGWSPPHRRHGEQPGSQALLATQGPIPTTAEFSICIHDTLSEAWQPSLSLSWLFWAGGGIQTGHST